MEERKYRFALLPDGIHVAEFCSPHEMLPYSENPTAPRDRNYSASLCPVAAVMGVSCGMEGSDAHYCLGVAQCDSYAQAYASLDDYIKGNGGRWLTAVHDIHGEYHSL